MAKQHDYKWDQNTTLKLGGWHRQFICPVLTTHWSRRLSALSSLHESPSSAHYVNGNQSLPLQTEYKCNRINGRIVKSNTEQHCSGSWYRTGVMRWEKNISESPGSWRGRQSLNWKKRSISWILIPILFPLVKKGSDCEYRKLLYGRINLYCVLFSMVIETITELK